MTHLIASPRSFVLCCVLAAGMASMGRASTLPRLGDTASQHLSHHEARTIDRQILRDLYRHQPLVEDLLLQRYLLHMIQRLLAASDEPEQQPAIVLLKDPDINAFAGPAGLIGLNSGLMLAARNQHELAAVLAHETAHVTQHHLARNLEQAYQFGLPSTAAMISAILLGLNNPALIQAAIATSAAGSAQSQINYTRQHEQEADSIGINILGRAGFNPHGMPDFFQLLYEQNRLNANQLPTFLRTHPVTLDRIAESRQRLNQHHLLHTAHLPQGSDERFRLMQARVRVLTEDRPNRLLEVLEEERHASAPGSMATRYALTLLAQKLHNFARAEQYLLSLLLEAPNRLSIMFLLIEQEQAQQHYAEALDITEKRLQQHPDNALLLMKRAELALRLHQPAKAMKSMQRVPYNWDYLPQYHLLMSQSQHALGHPGWSHYHLARLNFIQGRPLLAMAHLKLAKRVLPNADLERRLHSLEQQIRDESGAELSP